MTNEGFAWFGLMMVWTLFLLFLSLKLMGFIDWSWWYVSAPLWVPPALCVAPVVAVALYSVVVDEKEQEKPIKNRRKGSWND